MRQGVHHQAASVPGNAIFVMLASAAALLSASACSSSEQAAQARAREASAASERQASEWQEDFGLERRSLADSGSNRYFVLEPGFQLVLANDGERVTITVLDETEKVGDVTTRVVEEREEEDGELVEVSRNFFAICKDTGDVFYFGEDVDEYENGDVSGHPGSWRTGEKGARAALVMPGSPRVGMRYYQELASERALDRAEVLSLGETLKTPAGTFQGCLKSRESTPLEPDEVEYKTYAPGIGLAQDEDLLLVRYGPVAGK